MRISDQRVRTALLMVSAVALMAFLACSFFPFDSSSNSAGADPSPEPQTVEARISPEEGGTLEHPAGAQLTFEPGSLDREATVRLTSLGFEQPSATTASPLLAISQSFQIDLGDASLTDGAGASLSLQIPDSEQLDIPPSHVALKHEDGNGYLRLRSFDYDPETNRISQSLDVLDTGPSAISNQASSIGLAKQDLPSEQAGALDETLAIAYLPPTGSYDLPGQIGPLQVPYYSQSGLQWCTPTALSMMFGYHGDPYGITENWSLAAGIGLDRDTGGIPNYTALNNLDLPKSDYEFLWWDGGLIEWPQKSSGSDGAVLYRNTLFTSYVKWQLAGMDLREMVGPILRLDFKSYQVTIPTPNIRFQPRPVQTTSDVANHAFVIVGASEGSLWTHDSSGAVGDREPAAEISLDDFKEEVFDDTDNRELRSVVYNGGIRPEGERRGSIVLGWQSVSSANVSDSSLKYQSPGPDSHVSYWRWDGDENDNGYIWDDADDVFPDDADYGNAFPLEGDEFGKIEFKVRVANVTASTHPFELTYELMRGDEVLDSHVESMSLAASSWSDDLNQFEGNIDTTDVDSPGLYTIHLSLHQSGVLQDQKEIQFKVPGDSFVGGAIDSCLHGTWSVDQASYNRYLEQLLSGGDITGTSAEGMLDIEFEPDWLVTINMNMNITLCTSEGCITSNIREMGSASYGVDTETNTLSVGGGIPIVASLEGFTGEGGTTPSASAEYICEGDSLTILASGAPPLEYNRADD